MVETIRHLTDTGSETVSRSDYKLVQTPQVFDVELLKRAYAQEYTSFFTDDASVVEAMESLFIWQKAIVRISRLPLLLI